MSCMSFKFALVSCAWAFKIGNKNATQVMNKISMKRGLFIFTSLQSKENWKPNKQEFNHLCPNTLLSPLEFELQQKKMKFNLKYMFNNASKTVNSI